MKASLQQHLAMLIADEPGKDKQIKIYKEAQKLDPSEILSINFGLNQFAPFSKLQAMKKLVDEVHKIDDRISNAEGKAKEKLEKKKSKIIDVDLPKLQDEYMSISETKEVVTAFVVFRTAEGRERLKNQLNQTAANRCCLWCCCQSKRYKYKEFHKKYPNVFNADDPSVILWQNLGVSRHDRRCRILLTAIVTIILLLLCCLVNLYGSTADKEI